MPARRLCRTSPASHYLRSLHIREIADRKRGQSGRVRPKGESAHARKLLGRARVVPPHGKSIAAPQSGLGPSHSQARLNAKAKPRERFRPVPRREPRHCAGSRRLKEPCQRNAATAANCARFPRKERRRQRQPWTGGRVRPPLGPLAAASRRFLHPRLAAERSCRNLPDRDGRSWRGDRYRLVPAAQHRPHRSRSGPADLFNRKRVCHVDVQRLAHGLSCTPEAALYSDEMTPSPRQSSAAAEWRWHLQFIERRR